MKLNKMVISLMVVCAMANVASSEESKEDIELSENTFVEMWESNVAAAEEGMAPEERALRRQEQDALIGKWIEATKDDPAVLARAIVNLLMYKPVRDSMHPIAFGGMVMLTEDKFEITFSDLSRAIIENAPYLNDESERWALDLFRFLHGIGGPSVPPQSAIMREIVIWFDEFGANNSPESVFITLSALDTVSSTSFDALDALLENTGTTNEVLEEWGVSSVEELERPNTPAMMNRYLCSKNVWARLFGLNYVRSDPSWLARLDETSCLNDEAEHPLEARWAAELKSKLEAEAEKENTESETRKSGGE